MLGCRGTTVEFDESFSSLCSNLSPAGGCKPIEGLDCQVKKQDYSRTGRNAIRSYYEGSMKRDQQKFRNRDDREKEICSQMSSSIGLDFKSTKPGHTQGAMRSRGNLKRTGRRKQPKNANKYSGISTAFSNRTSLRDLNNNNYGHEFNDEEFLRHWLGQRKMNNLQVDSDSIHNLFQGNKSMFLPEFTTLNNSTFFNDSSQFLSQVRIDPCIKPPSASFEVNNDSHSKTSSKTDILAAAQKEMGEPERFGASIRSNTSGMLKFKIPKDSEAPPVPTRCSIIMSATGESSKAASNSFNMTKSVDSSVHAEENHEHNRLMLQKSSSESLATLPPKIGGVTVTRKSIKISKFNDFDSEIDTGVGLSQHKILDRRKSHETVLGDTYLQEGQLKKIGSRRGASRKSIRNKAIKENQELLVHLKRQSTSHDLLKNINSQLTCVSPLIEMIPPIIPPKKQLIIKSLTNVVSHDVPDLDFNESFNPESQKSLEKAVCESPDPVSNFEKTIKSSASVTEISDDFDLASDHSGGSNGMGSAFQYVV